MSAPSAEFLARVAGGKAWLDEAVANTNAQLLERLAKTRDKFLAELAGLNESQWNFNPPDKWSIRENCLHVSHAVRHTGLMAESLSRGEFPAFAADIRMGMLDEDPGNMAAAIALAEAAFDTARDSHGVLDGAPNLEMTLPHPLFGPLNCRAWIAFNIMHASYHVGQVQRVKAAPGYPA